MTKIEICPLLSLKIKEEKELHPCLSDKCGWFSYHDGQCGIRAIADNIPSSLAISIDEMPPVIIHE